MVSAYKNEYILLMKIHLVYILNVFLTLIEEFNTNDICLQK